MPVVQKKARTAEAVVAEACTWGEAEDVEAALAGADADTVDWDKMLGIAYSGKHTEVVRLIRDSGRVEEDVAKWLLWAAELGDADYLQSCINQGKDEGENVQWDKLIAAAYGAKHEDVVRIVRDGQRVSLWIQLYFSVLLDDSEFVESIIKKGDQEEGQEKVDWKKLFETAFRYNRKICQLIIENRKVGLSDLVESMFDDFDKTEFVVHHTPEDINMEVRPYLTPLHIACYGLVEKENYDINNVKAILNSGPENMLLQPGTEKEFWNQGVEVNKGGFMKRTPLHLMCHGHNDDISNIIKGITIPENETDPLLPESQSMATTLNPGGTIKGRQMADAIALIIERGAGVNIKDAYKQTPLHLLCASKGGSDIGELLLEKGAYINLQDAEGLTPLAVAVQHNNYKLLSFLSMQKQCDKNKGNHQGRTPLFWAARMNDAESTKTLCQQGVNINQADVYNVTPLATACEANNPKIVEILLANRADPNIADNEDRTALHVTATYRSVECCRALVNSNAHVDLDAQDITGCTPLHLVTSQTDDGNTHNPKDIVTILLDAGCDVNIANNLGNIPLHNAVYSGNNDIAEKLLKQGSKIDVCNNYGQSPIMIAASSLDLPMMNCLQGNSADVTLVDNMQRNLIHNVVAAFSTNTIVPVIKLKRFKDIVEWLLSKGLCVNATDLNKQTPLHLAAKDGFLQLVKFLVEKGTDVTLRDSFGHMPLMSALENWENPQKKTVNTEVKAEEDAEKIEEVVKQKQQVFQYLWDITFQNITEADFRKLQCLSYWLGLDDILEKIKQSTRVRVDLSTKPQNVQKLRCNYDLQLQKWLNSDDENLPDFMSNWLPSLQPLTYIDHPKIKHLMWDKFLPDLRARVEKEDQFLAYVIQRCGSVEEETKVFASDECDCSCVQKEIKFKMFEEPKEEGDKVLKAFVHLECKDQYVEKLKVILDSKKRLCQAKLCQYFGKLIAKVLADPKFWAQYPELQRVSPKDISAGDRRICTMQVLWSDDICPLLTIDIDLAPVIDLKDWKPSWCNKRDPLVDEIECIALPKWKMNYKVDMDLMELGVHSWAPIFKKMPDEMRQGYRLAKVVRDRAVCPQIALKPGTVPQLLTQESIQSEDQGDENVELSSASKFMNTYLLKQVIVKEFSKWDYERGEGKQHPNHSDVYWARRIYEKMEEAFEKQELNSWFIPSYNLLNDEMFAQYKDVAKMQARLCRRLLTEEAAAHFRKAYMGIHR